MYCYQRNVVLRSKAATNELKYFYYEYDNKVNNHTSYVNNYDS